jgi:hypothetical protein
VTSDVTVDPSALLAMVRHLSAEGAERKETGGVHGCAFGKDGEIVLIREDIGRHNAVDKLIGRAWLDRVPTDDLVLLSTGRVSYEMAVKAARPRADRGYSARRDRPCGRDRRGAERHARGVLPGNKMVVSRTRNGSCRKG